MSHPSISGTADGDSATRQALGRLHGSRSKAPWGANVSIPGSGRSARRHARIRKPLRPGRSAFATVARGDKGATGRADPVRQNLSPQTHVSRRAIGGLSPPYHHTSSGNNTTICDKRSPSTSERPVATPRSHRVGTTTDRRRRSDAPRWRLVLGSRTEVSRVRSGSGARLRPSNTYSVGERSCRARPDPVPSVPPKLRRSPADHELRGNRRSCGDWTPASGTAAGLPPRRLDGGVVRVGRCARPVTLDRTRPDAGATRLA